jgi:hypothetical protein
VKRILTYPCTKAVRFSASYGPTAVNVLSELEFKLAASYYKRFVGIILVSYYLSDGTPQFYALAFDNRFTDDVLAPHIGGSDIAVILGIYPPIAIFESPAQASLSSRPATEGLYLRKRQRFINKPTMV